MQHWSELYTLTASTAATLMGLLFVTLSVNLSLLSPGPSARRENAAIPLAEQAFQNYFAVVLVSLIALVPGATVSVVGTAGIVLTATWILWRIQQLRALGRKGGSRLQSLRRHIASLFGFGTLGFASISMANDGHELHVFAASLILLLGTATTVSWRLLLDLSKTKDASALPRGASGVTPSQEAASHLPPQGEPSPAAPLEDRRVEGEQ